MKVRVRNRAENEEKSELECRGASQRSEIATNLTRQFLLRCRFRSHSRSDFVRNVINYRNFPKFLQLIQPCK
jgi:hypothetical protein